jgi:hypothetical protein
MFSEYITRGHRIVPGDNLILQYTAGRLIRLADDLLIVLEAMQARLPSQDQILIHPCGARNDTINTTFGKSSEQKQQGFHKVAGFLRVSA